MADNECRHGRIIMESLLNIDWAEVYHNLWHLLLAFALAIPIGLNREQSSRNFGLRTFPLVAVVSCGFMMVGISVVDTTDGEARIFQGIVTGIGFIGGGAVFKDDDNVSGTASAASIWNTGAIGLAVAFDRFEIAIILSFLNFMTLWAVSLFKKVLPENNKKR